MGSLPIGLAIDASPTFDALSASGVSKATAVPATIDKISVAGPFGTVVTANFGMVIAINQFPTQPSISSGAAEPVLVVQKGRDIAPPFI